ncbi:MAG: hypothetical protein ABSA76_06270 [Bacteroidales bacterium]
MVRRKDFRLGGKDLYIFLWKGSGEKGDKGMVIICTNKKVLSERSSIGYENLVRVFTRQKRIYYEDSEGHLVMHLKVKDIIKGRQGLSRKGKGGIPLVYHNRY